jgi:hypothetical protein
MKRPLSPSVFRGDGWRLKNERRTAREFDSNPSQIEGKENVGATGGSPHDRQWGRADRRDVTVARADQEEVIRWRWALLTNISSGPLPLMGRVREG